MKSLAIQEQHEIAGGIHIGGAIMGIATVLRIDQPKVSALINGRLSGFTIDRLFRFLIALEQNVEIKITQRSITGGGSRRKSYSIMLYNN